METDESSRVRGVETSRRMARFHRDVICCFLCRGFLIDATTIAECMHTFCKSCLLQRLESIPSCPKCGVQLQRSRIGEQLRLDHVVQNIVYKCVPSLWHEEQRRRKHFSDTHPLGNTSLASVVPVLTQPVCFTPEDSISLSLDYIQPTDNESPPPPKLSLTENVPRRYFRCPAAVTVHHFQRLLSLKFDLGTDYKVDLYHKSDKLKPQYRLMDVAHIYNWTQEEPLRLQFRLTQSRSPSKSHLPSTNSSVVQIAAEDAGSQSQKPLRMKSPSAASPLKRDRESSEVQSASSAPTVAKKPKRTPVVAVPSQKAETSSKSSGKSQWRKTSKSPETPVRGSVYQAVHQMLKKKLPALLSNAVAKEQHASPQKGQAEPAVPVQEPVRAADEPAWERPSSGVELLVKAAELASQQCPTPPPSSSSESESIRSTPSGGLSVVDKPQQSPNGSLIIVEEEDEEDEMELEEQHVRQQQTVSPPPPPTLQHQQQCNNSSETALDLSSKSSRSQSDAGSSTTKPKPTLHSITESLAQRQQQLLQANKQQPVDAMRNLLTLSRTAAIVASSRPRSVAQPVNADKAAAQRLLAAMQRTFASFSATPTSVPVPRNSSNSQTSKTSALNTVQRPS